MEYWRKDLSKGLACGIHENGKFFLRHEKGGYFLEPTEENKQKILGDYEVRLSLLKEERSKKYIDLSEEERKARHREANKKYNKNKVRFGCMVTPTEAKQFKEYCRLKGTSVSKELSEFIDRCLSV